MSGGLQVFSPLGEHFAVEFAVTDAHKGHGRVLISTAQREVQRSALHGKTPLPGLRHGCWVNAVFDVHGIYSSLFPGSAAMQSVDTIELCGKCRLRKVFTMRQLPDGAFDEDGIMWPLDMQQQVHGPTTFADAIPRHLEFHPDTGGELQLFDWYRVAEHGSISSTGMTTGSEQRRASRTASTHATGPAEGHGAVRRERSRLPSSGETSLGVQIVPRPTVTVLQTGSRAMALSSTASVVAGDLCVSPTRRPPMGDGALGLTSSHAVRRRGSEETSRDGESIGVRGAETLRGPAQSGAVVAPVVRERSWSGTFMAPTIRAVPKAARGPALPEYAPVDVSQTESRSESTDIGEVVGLERIGESSAGDRAADGGQVDAGGALASEDSKRAALEPVVTQDDDGGHTESGVQHDAESGVDAVYVYLSRPVAATPTRLWLPLESERMESPEGTGTGRSPLPMVEVGAIHSPPMIGGSRASSAGSTGAGREGRDGRVMSPGRSGAGRSVVADDDFVAASTDEELAAESGAESAVVRGETAPGFRANASMMGEAERGRKTRSARGVRAMLAPPMSSGGPRRPSPQRGGLGPAAALVSETVRVEAEHVVDDDVSTSDATIGEASREAQAEVVSVERVVAPSDQQVPVGAAVGQEGAPVVRESGESDDSWLRASESTLGSIGGTQGGGAEDLREGLENGEVGGGGAQQGKRGAAGEPGRGGAMGDVGDGREPSAGDGRGGGGGPGSGQVRHMPAGTTRATVGHDELVKAGLMDGPGAGLMSSLSSRMEWEAEMSEWDKRNGGGDGGGTGFESDDSFLEGVPSMSRTGTTRSFSPPLIPPSARLRQKEGSGAVSARSTVSSRLHGFMEDDDAASVRSDSFSTRCVYV
jgi:hypothetical protein